MPGIITKFGTPEPVAFKEKGCETEFAARISGALYIDEYDEAAYGGTESERKEKLGAFAVGKIKEHLAAWDKDDKLLGVDGENQLGLMLNYDLMEAGITGSARIKDITITEETDGLYQEQIMKPYREAKQEAREKAIEAAVEPHGPLTEVSYNLSSHGMMAGSSSGISRKVTWNSDGTAIYHVNSYGGSSAKCEYKITPEMAKKISDYVTDKRIAALAKMDIPTAVMFDNFTSASISMTFDDSSIGGDKYNSVCLNCGPAGLTFKTIEDGLYELFEECAKTGECIKNETTQMDDGPFANFNRMIQMNMMGVTAPDPLDGMKKAQEEAFNAAVESTKSGASTPSAATNGKWTCKCGMENAGKFCANCGEPKPAGWVCSCDTVNTGKFCYNCGQPQG